jgi:phage-related protein
MPLDWKPLKNLGKGINGVYEVRIWEDYATFRIAYITKLGGLITVRHCWQKISQTTAHSDKAVIVERYKSAKEAFNEPDDR